MRPTISVQRLGWLLLALGVVWAVRQWLLMPVVVTGGSMQPTLSGGQLVCVNKIAYCFGEPWRGEVVLLWTGREYMLKRILGLPGENIAMREGSLYINGTPLTEPYVQLRDDSNIAPGQLGPGHFLVAGDNRPRTFIGVVNRNRIVGRVMLHHHAAYAAVTLKHP